MKRISIQDVEAGLAGVIAEAESGSTFLITRDSEPVAQLSPAQHVHVRHGARAGGIGPAVRRSTGGRYLAVPLDDRDGR